MKKNLVLLALIIIPLSFARLAFADTITLPNPLCLGGGVCIDSFAALIAQITTYLSTIIGILAILMLVIAGIMFVSSGGNPNIISRAKKTALYAAIGLAIALAGAGLIEVIKAVIGAPPG